MGSRNMCVQSCNSPDAPPISSLAHSWSASMLRNIFPSRAWLRVTLNCTKRRVEPNKKSHEGPVSTPIATSLIIRAHRNHQRRSMQGAIQRLVDSGSATVCSAESPYAAFLPINFASGRPCSAAACSIVRQKCQASHAEPKHKYHKGAKGRRTIRVQFS